MASVGLDLQEVRDRAREDIQGAESLQGLAEVRARYLGRRGSVSEVLRGIGDLDSSERGRIGREANTVKEEIEGAVAARRAELENRQQDEALAGGRLDVSLPGAGPLKGHLHPLTRVQRDLEDFFWGRGYSIEEGPEVETEYNNFEALN
ncbi:MAG: phenylalanine--tRNA ligase subunit alpha, partial [Myxococcota bacterium]